MINLYLNEGIFSLVGMGFTVFVRKHRAQYYYDCVFGKLFIFQGLITLKEYVNKLFCNVLNNSNEVFSCNTFIG